MPKVKAGVLGLKAVLFFSFETDFGQCDKENHGWCEARRDRPCQASICYRAFTLR
jgi:hypothetical protein